MFSVLLIFYFFCVCFVSGRAVLKLFHVNTEGLVPLISFSVGSVLTTFLIFLVSLILPFSQVAILGELSFIILLVLVYQNRSLRQIPAEISVFTKNFLKPNWAAAIFLLIFFSWLFGRALIIGKNGDISAGDRLVWADWPLHIGIAANFAYGQNFPPQNPTFAGKSLIYPFMSDFLSAILLALGADLKAAFVAPGIILSVCFGLLFLALCQKLSKENAGVFSKAGFMAFIISLFWGGIGFVYWIKDLYANWFYLFENLAFPSREYTFWQEKNLWFFSFFFSEILPQRAFLFGLPIFFTLILLFITGWEKRAKANFILAGILGGILPFFHTHTFIAVWILLPVFFMILGCKILFFEKQNKKLFLEAVFLFGVPFVFLSLVQAPFFLKPGMTIPFEFGWMKGKENFFWFWFKNTGIFLPLMLAGLISKKFSYLAKILGIASLALFIVPNLFRFAPWGYDNLKIFTYWYLLGSIFAGGFLVNLAKKIRPFGKILALVFLVTLILSGLLEMTRLFHLDKTQIRLWSSEDQEFAELVKEKTSPRAIFLTAAIHDHPVESLAGRKIVIGYPGNSWSWGISGWDTRESDVRLMFQGGETAINLWKKYGVNYIIIGDRERYFAPDLDEDFINKNGEVVVDKGKTKVYRIK